MTTPIELKPEHIREVVLITGASHVIKSWTVAPVSAAGITLKDAVIIDNDKGQRIIFPASSIAALLTPQFKSDADVAAEKSANEARQVRAFERHHYTDKATFDRLLDAQKSLCAICKNSLEGMPVVHYYEGRLLCRADSPLTPRWGED